MKLASRLVALAFVCLIAGAVPANAQAQGPRDPNSTYAPDELVGACSVVQRKLRGALRKIGVREKGAASRSFGPGQCTRASRPPYSTAALTIAIRRNASGSHHAPIASAFVDNIVRTICSLHSASK